MRVGGFVLRMVGKVFGAPSFCRLELPRPMPIARFVEETCLRGSGLWVGSAALRERYRSWCESNGETLLSAGDFAQVLKRDFGFRPSRSRRWNGKQLRTFEGVALLLGQSASENGANDVEGAGVGQILEL